MLLGKEGKKVNKNVAVIYYGSIRMDQAALMYH